MTRDQILTVGRLLDVPLTGALILLAGSVRDDDTPVATVPGRVDVLAEALVNGEVSPEEVADALHRARYLLASGEWPGVQGVSLTEASVVLSSALTGFDRAA